MAEDNTTASESFEIAPGLTARILSNGYGRAAEVGDRGGAAARAVSCQTVGDPGQAGKMIVHELLVFADFLGAVFAGDGAHPDVLVHGEVGVEGEPLRHVADASLDRIRFGRNIVPGHRAAASARLQQSTEDTDRRCLAGAVGTEKAELRIGCDDQ